MKQDTKRTLLGTIGCISASALLMVGASQLVLAAQMGKTEQIPTVYPSATPAANLVPDGYQKANYKLVMAQEDDTEQPKDIHLTMEQAGELGAQALWRYFGVALTDKTVEMSLIPPLKNSNVEMSKIKWEGYVSLEKGVSYYFELDAVTGELYDVGVTPEINTGTPPRGYQDYSGNTEYPALGVALAEELHLLPGKPIKCEIVAQGATNDNEDVGLEVSDDTGKRVRMTVLTKTKRPTMISFDGSVKEMEWIELETEREMGQSDSAKVFTIREGEAGVNVSYEGDVDEAEIKMDYHGTITDDMVK